MSLLETDEQARYGPSPSTAFEVTRRYSGRRRLPGEFLRRPCLGVFPYEHGVALDEEDGVSLDDAPTDGPVAIIRFPHISNFTDFDRISGAAWIEAASHKWLDTVILPGTKNTTGDCNG